MALEFVEADFEKWARRELWTLWQASFIVGGIEPVDTGADAPSTKLVAGILDAIPDTSTRRRVTELYAKAKDARGQSLPIAEDSRTGWIGNIRVKPGVFIDWAQNRNVVIPQALRSRIDCIAKSENADAVKDDGIPEFVVNPRPRVVDPALLALDRDAIVRFSGKIGRWQGTSQQRASAVIAEIEAQIKRQVEGFFTVEEAAQVLADSLDGVDVAKLIDQMRGAFRNGKLPIRDSEHRLPHFKESDIFELTSLVTISDIDAWLDGSRTGYRFPVPSDSAEAAPRTMSKNKGELSDSSAGSQARQPLPRQRFQEQEILRVIGELGFSAKALPKAKLGTSGPKAAVREKLVFPAGVFDKAWGRLRSQGDIQDAQDAA